MLKNSVDRERTVSWYSSAKVKLPKIYESWLIPKMVGTAKPANEAPAPENDAIRHMRFQSRFFLVLGVRN